MIQLPFVTAPTEKTRIVGNDAVGTLEIRSIGAMTDLETDYYEANRTDWQRQLVTVTKDAMTHTKRKYPWRDVLNAVYSLVTNDELLIPELEKPAVEFNEWYDANVVRNNKIAAVAIMRNRVKGCEEMTIDHFNDDAIVKPGIRAKLIEFAINESNGWPKEQEGKKPEGKTEGTSTASQPILEVTEEDAAK